MPVTLDFEKPIAELESKLAELRHLSSNGEVNIVSEVKRLQEKSRKTPQKILSKSYSLAKGIGSSSS